MSIELMYWGLFLFLLLVFTLIGLPILYIRHQRTLWIYDRWNFRKTREPPSKYQISLGIGWDDTTKGAYYAGLVEVLRQDDKIAEKDRLFEEACANIPDADVAFLREHNIKVK